MLRWWRRQEGQATLEAAVVLPLILMLLVGMVGLTMVLQASTITMMAANRGARVGAVAYGNPDLAPADRETLVRDAVEKTLGSGLKGQDYTIDIATTATDIQVRVSYRMKVAIPGLKLVLGSDTWGVNHVSSYLIEAQ